MTNFKTLDEIYIGYGNDRKGPFKLKGIQSRGKTFFLEIEGVEDLQSANALIGCQSADSRGQTGGLARR